MRSPETVIETAQELFVEVCGALCRVPDALRVEFHDDGTSIRVQIEAHPTDARILVGKGAMHIKQLAALARSLFWGSRRVVQIMPVESINADPIQQTQFQPLDDWDEDYLADLLKRLAGAAFYGCDASMESESDTDWSQNMRLTIRTSSPSPVLQRFAVALSVLFVPIGTNFGRIIYVTVKGAQA